MNGVTARKGSLSAEVLLDPSDKQIRDRCAVYLTHQHVSIAPEAMLFKADMLKNISAIANERGRARIGITHPTCLGRDDCHGSLERIGRPGIGRRTKTVLKRSEWMNHPRIAQWLDREDPRNLVAALGS